MDDDGNLCAPGGEATENTSFATVGMDNMRFLFPQDFFQFAEGDEIFQRVNRADEFGNQCEQSGVFFNFRLQRAFRAGRWSGNQADFDAGFLAQTQDGGDRILLCPANDEPRNDVRDAHGAFRMIYFWSSRNRVMTLVASAVLVGALAR
jgi:hypothetical protein